MTEGPDAVDALIARYPRAGVFFGYGHLTPDNFARVMDQWLVIEDSGCWVMLEGGGPDRALHWFCPEGASLPAIRRALHHAFTYHGVRVVRGTQPKAHPNRRAARVLAHALGAVRDGDGHALTAERFQAYSAAKRRLGEGV